MNVFKQYAILAILPFSATLTILSTASSNTPYHLTANEAAAHLPHHLARLDRKIPALQAQMKMLLSLNQSGQLTPTAEYQIAAQINRLIKDIWHYLKPAQAAAKKLHSPVQKALNEVEYTVRRISYLTLTSTKTSPQIKYPQSVKNPSAKLNNTNTPLAELAQINTDFLSRLPKLSPQSPPTSSTTSR